MRRRNIPARHPPNGAWPAQMRADMTAAYLDYPDTKALLAAIARGEAPDPSSMRGSGAKREPVWSRDDLDRHVAPLAPQMHGRAVTGEDLQALVK